MSLRPAVLARPASVLLLAAVLLATGACGDLADPQASGPLTTVAIPESGTPPTAQDTGGAITGSFLKFDGQGGDLASYRGTPLVVNFWASWCAPCTRELPDFDTVHRELGASVAFLGVNVSERLEDANKFLAKTPVSFDLGRDPRGELLAALGGVAMPTTAFIDAAGRVVAVQSRSFTAAELRARIQKDLLS